MNQLRHVPIVINGEESIYSIYENGVILNHFRGKQMSIHLNHHGLVVVYLTHKGKRYTRSVEKLLREEFGIV